MKKIFTLLATAAIASSASAGDFVLTSSDIVNGKTGSVELGNGSYGKQDVSDASTWYTFAKGGCNFEAVKICKANGSNKGIQVQGNASDTSKQGFIGNVTPFGKIETVEIVICQQASNPNAPGFNLYTGTEAHPASNAIVADTVKTTVGDYTNYKLTYNVTNNATFFQIKNDLVGALYIDQITVKGDLGEISPSEDTFEVSFDSKTNTISVTPSNKDRYYSFAYDTSEGWETSSDDPKTFIGELLSKDYETLDEAIADEILVKGDVEWQLTEDDFENIGYGEYLLTICYVNEDLSTSESVFFTFVVEEPEELPVLQEVNTIANIKACYDKGVVKDNDEVKVAGYISGMFIKPADLEKYHDINIWLTDTLGGAAKEFELYNCFSVEGANFTTIGDGEIDMTSTANTDFDIATDENGVSINVGDYVVAMGKITKYNGTYELARSCKLVSATSGIESIHAEVEKSGKMIKNNKLYIISNNKTYNAAGMIVE